MSDAILFLKFVFFSMLESFAIVAIMLALFRFKVTNYIWPIVFLTLSMSLQSYVLREELALSSFVPIINLILLTFFTMQFVRVPMIWSILISTFGSVATILIQVLLVALSGNSVEWFRALTDREYLMQVLTFIVSSAIAYVLYKFGIGFSFAFEKLRFKWERLMIYTLLILIMVGFVILASQRSVYVDIGCLLFALFLFVFYTLRKEQEDD
ncbi:MAG: hypothetical protein P0Y55_15680 [Candidatus Cohnella colombiensis]|uniref:Uncharacterized protein n=1 Tax=Candidatus Cohnella colombiensis TaxID=3121368 RepID=A0AA95EV24_9BACL|nr:MAG: hypothetical protein P0Y55_15680 [Cohnella sp.]